MFGRDAIRYQSHQNQGNLSANQCKELHKHFAETCSHCDTHATTLGRIIVKRAVTYTNTHMHTYMHTYIHAHIRVSRHERDPVAAPEE